MLIVVASGFVFSLFAPLIRRFSNSAAGWILSSVPAALAVYLLTVAPAIWTGNVMIATYSWAPSLGLDLSFRLDGLSLLFALLITGIGAIVLVYGGMYLREHSHLGRFYAFLLFFMASMVGLVLANNLLLVYIFWELTGISSYLLIGFEHDRLEARRAALQALLVTGLGGLSLLAGIVLLGQMAGTFDISAILQRGATLRENPLYPAALSLILIGAFTKSAQFPFHFWLPRAMEAPTPVSAYLHAATMVKAGIYLLARLNPVLGGTEAWSTALMGVGAVSMVGGAALALTKTDLKRILAYSTVSILGVLTFLIGLGTPVALRAMAVCLVAHALYKGALFLVAGALDHEAGTRDITKLGALWKAMPATACAGVLAALSMAGLPPLLGFSGKELLYESGLRAPAHQQLLTAAVVIAGALLFVLAAVAGFEPFFGRPKHARSGIHEAAFTLWIGPLLLSAGGLVLGLAPMLLDDPVRSAVAAIAPAANAHVDLALFHGVTPALYLSMASVAGGLALYVLHEHLLAAGPRCATLAHYGPAAFYQRSLEALNRIATAQTRVLQAGYLRVYLLIVIATTVGLVGTALGRWAALPDLIGPSGPHFHEAVLAVSIIVATIAAVRTSSRLTSVAALGVVGIGVSLFFALFGAPDLAMTQLTVETLTVILLVLVLYHLPDFGVFGQRRNRIRNFVISAVGGVLMAVLVLTASSVQYAPGISRYYLENTYTQAHGRNVVDVILTDFRSFDTLGEITVVAVSAVGVWALVRFRSGEGRRK